MVVIRSFSINTFDLGLIRNRFLMKHQLRFAVIQEKHALPEILVISKPKESALLAFPAFLTVTSQSS